MSDLLAALDNLEPNRGGCKRWAPESPELGAKILERYAEGISGNAIGEALGVSPMTVRRWIKDQRDTDTGS